MSAPQIGRPRGSRDRRGRAVRAVARAEAKPFLRAVAANIATICDEFDLSASEVAAALGVHVDTVEHWQHARRVPQLARLYQLAVAFGVSVTVLVETES